MRLDFSDSGTLLRVRLHTEGNRVSPRHKTRLPARTAKLVVRCLSSLGTGLVFISSMDGTLWRLCSEFCWPEPPRNLHRRSLHRKSSRHKRDLSQKWRILSPLSRRLGASSVSSSCQQGGHMIIVMLSQPTTLADLGDERQAAVDLVDDVLAVAPDHAPRRWRQSGGSVVVRESDLCWRRALSCRCRSTTSSTNYSHHLGPHHLEHYLPPNVASRRGFRSVGGGLAGRVAD